VSRIYWDTMLFIYWIEEHPEYSLRVGELHKTMMGRGDSLCTSVFTAGEILTGMYKRGAVEQATEIRNFFRAPNVEMLPFTLETADYYGRIRAQHRVSPADALHLATAAQAGVNLFLTHDHRLKKLNILGIDFIAGMDVNVL
jgi:predicted nucleic acid-binding protein